MRSDRIPEQRVVVATDQPVMPTLLFIGPAARQVGERNDVVIDDRPIAHRRPEDAEAAPAQRIEKCGDAIARQDARRP